MSLTEERKVVYTHCTKVSVQPARTFLVSYPKLEKCSFSCNFY